MKTATLTLILAILVGCSDAKVANHNLMKASEDFELERRIVFMNSITDKYMLVIEGRCDIQPDNLRTAVTCKIGPDEYKRHFLGNADNVLYFAEQLEPAEVSSYRYRVFFKPSVIVPDVDLKVGGDT